MKQVSFLLLVIAVVFSVVGCQPESPTPPAQTPTTVPSAAPTANFRATEALIIAHVFGTLTASAPTPTKVAPQPPTATPRPSVARPTTAVPRATRTATTAAAAPKPTADPYLAQIPKGDGGVLVINFYGDRQATFNIAGQTKQVPPNGGKVLFVVAPGPNTFTVSVPNAGASSGLLVVPENRYVTYSVAASE